MHIKTRRENLLPAVVTIGGVVERRQTLPILGNVLIRSTQSGIELTATDLEVEVTTIAATEQAEEGEFTLPAKKFIDICKALPEGSVMDIGVEGDKAVIRSERSRFSLGALPASDYPSIEMNVPDFTLDIKEGDVKRLIDRTSFSMAQHDVRYYLNGMLLEIENDRLQTVSTDGHRLALSKKKIDNDINKAQLLIPRKAVMELGRLLQYSENNISMEISKSFARFKIGNTIFTTKLIDGRFPDYEKVIPKSCGKFAQIDRDAFRQALIRASILSSEKYKGIRLTFSDGMLELQAHNPEQEEAEEQLPIEYKGEQLTIGFNVGYLLDILSVLEGDTILLELGDTNNSALLRSPEDEDNIYVVMPMRL